MTHTPLNFEVCIHEAGHAVAACYYGIDFHQVQVDFDLDTEQTTGMLSQGRGTPTHAGISISGPAALAYYRGEAEHLDFRGIESSPGARGDIHAIYRNWYGSAPRTRRDYYGGEFARHTERLFRTALQEIIDPLFPFIGETARRLQSQEILSPEEVRALLFAGARAGS